MPSQREEIAILLTDTVGFAGLVEGKKRGYEKSEHAWVIPFKKTGVISGRIHVYNPTSIVIQWKTEAKRGTQICKRPVEAIEFFRKFIK